MWEHDIGMKWHSKTFTFKCPTGSWYVSNSSHNPTWPFLRLAILSRILLSTCLQLGCTSSCIRHPSMPFICLPVSFPWGYSSENLTIHLANIPGCSSPVCPDTCRGVSHLSYNSIYILRCHPLPWFQSFRQRVLSGCFKTYFFISGVVEQKTSTVVTNANFSVNTPA